MSIADKFGIADRFGEVAEDLEKSPDVLRSIEAAVEQTKLAESELAMLNEDAAALRAAISKLKEFTIPEMMDQVNLKKITIAGCDIVLKEDFYGGIPKDAEKREAALLWLKKHDGGGLIQTEVITRFGQSESEQAMALANSISAEGGSVEMIQNVHPMTLKKFARTRMSDGESLAPETLGLHFVRQAKMTLSKEG